MEIKQIYLLSALLLSSTAFYAQVGINTQSPSSTLEIAAKNSTGATTNIDGLLIPRVDRLRAQSMTTAAISTMIYVNDISTGAQVGTAQNIDEVGYYFYNGTLWAKLHNPNNLIYATVNFYNTDGTLTGNRVVSQENKTLAFTGTVTNAFSVDGSTFSVDAANNRVGIGNAAPATDLHIGSPTGPVVPTMRFTTSLNDYTGGGVIQFLENNQGYGTIIRHHTGDNVGITQKEGLYFNSLAANVESAVPTMMLDQTAQRVGIGTALPTNKLHVNATDPLRLEGLQASSGSSGTLAVNSTGVVQLRNSSSISALRATGNVAITTNNTFTTIGTPTETFDNLNEFTGTTFTAASTGLYKVDFSINYPQRANTEDSGDGYIAYATINLNGAGYSSKITKITLPETSGAPASITASNSELIKMTAGNTLTFQGLTFGSTPSAGAPITGSYIINITRID
jgi:hypothetical protein